MLYTVVDDQITLLAAHLAGLLSTPLADPFAPEWIAVPTIGMQRWLSLELAKTLGSSGPQANDGVATNLGITFPGSLRSTLLDWQGAGEPSPWEVERLVWATLAVLVEHRSDPSIGAVTALPEGCTWYSRARQIADLFDRYSVRRPVLLRAWSNGQDVDPSGSRLETADRWQPALWRYIRAAIGEANPAEQLPVILDRVRSGEINPVLPPRLMFFGLTTFPNGNEFLDLVDAVAQRRDVYLYLLDPAIEPNRRVANNHNVPSNDLLRAHHDPDVLISHPLLRSWGRPYRERTILLDLAKIEGRIRPEAIVLPPHGNVVSEPVTLLQKVQFDIAHDLRPDGSFTLDESDSSIQIHSCYGELRQVEALRSAILHQMQHDSTLDEEDIVVICPDIGRFAPLFEAGFGPSVDDAAAEETEHGPRLRWRTSDRSLRAHQAVFTALQSMLQIAQSQASASEVLAFVSLEPVSKKFELSDDDIATVERWVETGHVRWGFDSEHRTHWSLPAGISQGTWEELIDRLLLGIALDDAIELPPGGIAPIAVDTGSSKLLGIFADLLHRLRRFVDRSRGPRSISEWGPILQEAIVEFFATDEDNEWQIDQALALVASMIDSSQQAADLAIAEITLRDIAQIVHEAIESIGGRSNFFRGGITITSLLPLRWIPYRVICLVGIDEESVGAMRGGVDGDDLIARNPQIGDRDPRSELRQTLLEALLAARQTCIVTLAGRSINTNHEVPPATVISELTDVLKATINQESQVRFTHNVMRNHDRHGFANNEFIRGRYVPGQPWSFSKANLQVALRRAEQQDQRTTSRLTSRLGDENPMVINIDKLIEFIRHPVKFYFANRLQLSFPAGLNELDERLPVELTGLAAWEVADRYIDSRFSGLSTGSWQEHEQALGTVPIGSLGEQAFGEVRRTVDAMFDRATELGLDFDKQRLNEISVELADGTQIQGSIQVNLATINEGTLAITYSQSKEEHHLAAWIRLMALIATEPSVDWKSIVVSRERKNIIAPVLSMSAQSPNERQNLALEGLRVAADLFRRSLREPLPLFGDVSRKIHRNSLTPDDWFTYYGRGAGDDPINQFAFGTLGLADVLSLSAQPYDPAGPSPSRAKRLADFLWASVEKTSVSND